MACSLFIILYGILKTQLTTNNTQPCDKTGLPLFVYIEKTKVQIFGIVFCLRVSVVTFGDSYQDKGFDAWWRKRSNPASEKLHNGWALWGFRPPRCTDGADWQSYRRVGENLCHQGRWKWTGVSALLTEWLHSALQRGSNIVPNPPQATCNLLRRLQPPPHTPRTHPP